MKLESNTILITGGASGIGFALAEHFLKLGNTVIVCGRRRREDNLQAAIALYPKLHFRICDVSKESERVELFEWCTSHFPKVNVVINNAGIQRRIDLNTPESWHETSKEIATNFEAPVHLSQLFISHLSKQENPALINVTSGLAFSPLANVPVYCATKAAMRSFTLSLRHQLKKTSIEVIEIIPPAVNTDLGGVGMHTFGAPLKDFSESVMKQLAEGSQEITFGFSEKALKSSREELNETFRKMNEQRTND